MKVLFTLLLASATFAFAVAHEEPETVTISSKPEETSPRCEKRDPTFTGLDKSILHLYDCYASHWSTLPVNIFKPVNVGIKCASSWYTVYIAEDIDKLKEKFAQSETSWCGFASVLDGTVCNINASPFQRTLVAIKGPKNCTLASSAPLNYVMMGAGIAGIILFAAAGRLSTSFAFRFSCGTALFTAGSVVILLVFLLRMMPHKKTMAVVAGAAGSSGLALVRYLTGTWLPSWRQVVNNRFFATYLVVSGLLGAVVTYLYDDMRNPRVNSVIKAMLRLLGLVLVYLSSWTHWGVSATLIGVLVANLIAPDVAKGVQETGARVHRAAQVVHDVITTPFSTRKRAARTPATATPLATPREERRQSFTFTAPRTSPRQELPEPQTLFASLSRPASRTNTPGATPATGMQSTMYQSELLQPGEIESLTPRDYGNSLTPIHLRMSPPNPWEVIPKRVVKTYEEAMTHALLQRARPGSRRGTGEGSHAATASGMGEQDMEVDDVSDYVKQHHILNPNTKRMIRIGGEVYLKLLEQGYQPDIVNGIMVPPDGAVTIGSAPNSGRGRGSGARSRLSSGRT